MSSGFGLNARAGSSKSLIEDEADLSDWVGGLRSSSVKKTRVYSDSDNAAADDSGRKSGGFDRRDGSGKRRRYIDFDRDAKFGNRLGGRGRKGGRRGSSNFSKDGKFGEERRERSNGYLSRGNGERKVKGQSERGLGMPNGKRGGRSGDQGGGLAMNRGEKGVVRRGFIVMDDEDVEDEEAEMEEGNEKGYASFKKLIDSDEDDDDGEMEVEEDEEEEVVRAKLDKGRSTNELPKSSSQSSDSYLSESGFDQCSVSPLSLKGIKDAGYEKMTMVQEATLPVILKGKDVMAKAKTGTGKTVAFLQNQPLLFVIKKRPPIVVLVICPTRELASQAATEANKLLKYHPSIGVQVIIGGTRLALEQKRMQANPCQEIHHITSCYGLNLSWNKIENSMEVR